MTRNQITERIRGVAENHKQIASFSLGDIIDSLQNRSLAYPACFVDINSGLISKTEKKTIYSVEIWLCDLLNVNEGAKDNESEVFSDLTSIAEDVLATLYDPQYSDWFVQTEANIEYYKEKFVDETCALKLTVQIASAFEVNRCQIPVIS